jgi:hypothetical protein
VRRARLPIKLPSLYDAEGSTYTVGGLMVVFFGSRLGQIASKAELVEFLRGHGCRSVDPQPRHLGMQVGLNFLVQGCWHPGQGRKLRRGEYCLLDVRHAHPNRHTMHRDGKAARTVDFEPIKAAYGHRCACCGSREDEPHLKNSHLITRLDRGHCDPRRPLDSSNCIPMCTTCNMVYKDRAVINKRGFISSWLGIDIDPPSKDGVGDDDKDDASSSASFKTCVVAPEPVVCTVAKELVVVGLTSMAIIVFVLVIFVLLASHKRSRSLLVA